MSVSRHQVLGAYRNLLKAQKQTFKGDWAALAGTVIKPTTTTNKVTGYIQHRCGTCSGTQPGGCDFCRCAEESTIQEYRSLSLHKAGTVQLQQTTGAFRLTQESAAREKTYSEFNLKRNETDEAKIKEQLHLADQVASLLRHNLAQAVQVEGKPDLY
ncbi:hypothetical protein BGZ97_006374, partial [Linnemannia gamsii]